MLRVSALAVLSLAAGSLALSHFDPHTFTSHQIKQRTTNSRRSSTWSLVDSWKGQDLLDAFSYSTGGCDNGGDCTWAGQDSDLLSVGKNAVYIKVDHTPVVASGSRKAIKMISNKSYSNFLMSVDVLWQPQVCGVWPAVWLTSTTESWPAGGEIDLIEYVNKMSADAFSIHTSSGCSMQAPTSKTYTGVQMLSGSSGLNCDADATASQGCGIRSTQTDSAGIGANSIGGGKYVVQQDSAGVKMWFFKRDAIPSDLADGNPNPDGWTTPDFSAPASTCPESFFSPQNIIINTNLGGTWAEGAWKDASAYAGQTGGSCASQTGFDTAADYIDNKGEDFKHAYWKFASIEVWQ